MNQIQLHTSKEIAPGDNGVMFFRAPNPLELSNVEVGEGAKILRVVAGPHTIEAKEGETWASALAGRRIDTGVFVNIHVTNTGSVAAALSGALTVESEAIPAEVVQSGRPQVSDARPFMNAPAAPSAQPQASTRGVVRGGGRSGSLMQTLPTVRHGKVDPTQPRPVFSTSQPGAAAASPNRTAAPAAVYPGGTLRPAISKSATSKRVVQSAKPSVERRPMGAPVSPAVSPVAPAIASEDVTSELLADKPEVASGNVRAVALMTGHALAIRNTLEHRAPIRPMVKRSILASLARSAGPQIIAPQVTATDVVLHLSQEDVGVLWGIVSQGHSTGHPRTGAIVEALNEALSHEVAKTG